MDNSNTIKVKGKYKIKNPENQQACKVIFTPSELAVQATKKRASTIEVSDNYLELKDQILDINSMSNIRDTQKVGINFLSP